VSTGNILGGVLSSLVLSIGLSWRYVFFVPALLMLVWTLMCVVWLHRAPSIDERHDAAAADNAALLQHDSSLSLANAVVTIDSSNDDDDGDTRNNINTVKMSDFSSSAANDNNDDDDDDDDDSGDIMTKTTTDFNSNDNENGDERKARTSFLRAWLLPGVAAYALCNAFTKLVSYALLFWLPLYYTDALGESEQAADLVATLYDVGGVVGGICFGALSDWTLHRGAGRSLTLVPLLLFSALTLLLYMSSGAGVVNMLLLILCGMFSNSAYNLINSAVSSDLGQKYDAIGTVTGIIDGSASVGAALGQELVALTQEAFGWPAVFWSLIGSALLSSLFLCRIFVQEFRDWLLWRARHRHRAASTLPADSALAATLLSN
jgi:sugar phosphate permease